MKSQITSFTKLDVWREAHALVLLIYKLTKKFPNEEKFGLTDQLRRAAVSITSNIAEGFYRRTYKDKINFYYHALASTGEVQNQLLIARDLKYIVQEEFVQMAEQSITVHKLLNGLIKSSYKKFSS